MSPSCVKVEGNDFLECYSNVMVHHVDCILNSRLLLDEDIRVVLTFWNPNILTHSSNGVAKIITGSACAAVGLLISLKHNTLYPFVFSVMPTAVRLYLYQRRYFTSKKYKQHLEALIHCLHQGYEVHKHILEYYHKRDAALQARTMPDCAYKILLRPGNEFLQYMISILTVIIDRLRDSMLSISEVVPISSDDYVKCIQWKLDEFRKLNQCNFQELIKKFEKLSDMYILSVSNFLSCLALSMCIQLWKDQSCYFKQIFNYIIPELNNFMNLSLKEIKKKFDMIQFTLADQPQLPKHLKQKSKCNMPQLEQPLSDFLANTQIAFETSCQIYSLLNNLNIGDDFKNFIPLVDILNKQFHLCENSLRMFTKTVSALSRKPPSDAPLKRAVSSSDEEKTLLKCQNDNFSDLLEDEEYNLYIHGSDEEEPLGTLTDFTDQCSAQDLESVLYELKKKLEERKSSSNRSEEASLPKPRCKSPNTLLKPISSSSSQDVHYPEDMFDTPSPLPPLRLPPIDEYSDGYLQNVKAIADKMKSSEEIFFSDTTATFLESDES